MTRTNASVRRTVVGVVAVALLAGPAFAHHSFAMFDTKARGSLTGTVKQLDWTNPHVTLWVFGDVKPGAAPELWNFETSSPGNLTRGGWTKRSFQPGDKVQIDYFPQRGVPHAGELARVTLPATGKSFDLEMTPGATATSGQGAN